ncbi:MAG: acyl carrier protein [Pseudomonadota bacterium]
MSNNSPMQDTAALESGLAKTAHTSQLETQAVLRAVLTDVLGIAAEDADELEAESGLFGHLPELDSMAVAGLLTEIEDRLGIVIEDDDVDGEMLETFGGLLSFVNAKVAEI